MVKDYIIAEHRIRIEGEKLIEAVMKIEGFTPFEVEVSGEPLATITSEGTSTMLAPALAKQLYTVTTEDGVKSVFGRTTDGFRFDICSPRGADAVLWGKQDENRWKIKGSTLENGIELERLVRFTIWIAYGLSTSQLDTVAVHTSTITYQGKNVLFLGESGTGKSTHTRLWRENIEGATLLNDDSPILRIKENGEAWIYGSPWSGKTPCYKNESYPLAGCVRLSQAPYNKIEKLRVIQAYAAIHPSCPPDFAYDKYLYGGISRTISKLIAQVPFYHLACLPNKEAAELSCSTIFRPSPTLP